MWRCSSVSFLYPIGNQQTGLFRISNTGAIQRIACFFTDQVCFTHSLQGRIAECAEKVVAQGPSCCCHPRDTYSRIPIFRSRVLCNRGRRSPPTSFQPLFHSWKACFWILMTLSQSNESTQPTLRGSKSLWRPFRTSQGAPVPSTFDGTGSVECLP
jgi:hypothetical protein